MRKFWASWLACLALGAGLLGSRAACGGPHGGELGNPYIGFESRIGGFALEYASNWQFFDLSMGANFTDSRPGDSVASNFLTVMADPQGDAATLEDLRLRLQASRPGVEWSVVTLGGVAGFQGVEGELHFTYLLRGPGDVLAIRYRSKDAEGAKVVEHMLGSFRARNLGR